MSWWPKRQSRSRNGNSHFLIAEDALNSQPPIRLNGNSIDVKIFPIFLDTKQSNHGTATRHTHPARPGAITLGWVQEIPSKREKITKKRREDQQREAPWKKLIAFGISKASFDLFNQSARKQSLNIKLKLCWVWQKIVSSSPLNLKIFFRKKKLSAIWKVRDYSMDVRCDLHCGFEPKGTSLLSMFEWFS